MDAAALLGLEHLTLEYLANRKAYGLKSKMIKAKRTFIVRDLRAFLHARQQTAAQLNASLFAVDAHMILKALPLLLACFPAIAGDVNQCGFIRDSDLQSYCRGTAGSDQSQCGFIRDSDLQSLCKAEAGGGQSQCGFIRDADKRSLCIAKAKP